LLMILFVWAFDLTISLREAQAAAFVQDERFYASEAVAQALRDLLAREAAERQLVDFLELPLFDVKRLTMVAETMPAGVQLLHADIDEYGAVLTFLTVNLSLADIHREAWLESGIAESVQMTSVIATDNALRYVLSLRW